MRNMGKLIKKMRLDSGMVLVVKEGTELAKTETIKALGEVIESNTNLHDVIVVVAKDLDDIKALNEAAMREHGWYRIHALRRIIHVKDDVEPEKEEEHARTNDPDA